MIEAKEAIRRAPPPPNSLAIDSTESVASNNDTRRLSSFTPADQLALLERVEELCAEKDLPDACAKAGITIKKYYGLWHRKEALEKKVAQAQRKKEAEKTSKTVDVPNEMQGVVCDAVNMLAMHNRSALSESATELGCILKDVREWQKTRNLQPLFRRTREREPLQPDQRPLGVGEKMRIIQAVAYMQSQTQFDINHILDSLGYRQSDLESWQNANDVVRRMQEAKGKDDRQLTLMELRRLVADTGMQPADLQSWIEMYKLNNPFDERLSLPTTVAPIRSLDQMALADAWEKVWNEPENPEAIDQLTGYYEPLAWQEAEVRARTMPSSTDVEALQSFAFASIPTAIARYSREEPQAFYEFARRFMRSTMLWDSAEHSSLPLLVRRDRRQLRDARAEWAQQHSGEEPTLKQLQQVLGVSLDQIYEMVDAVDAACGTASLTWQDSDGEMHDHDPSFPTRTPFTDDDEADEASSEVANAVTKLLDLLSLKERRFVELHYLQGVHADEAAQAVGVDVKHQWKFQRDLLQRLRDSVFSYTNDDGLLRRIADRLEEQLKDDPTSKNVYFRRVHHRRQANDNDRAITASDVAVPPNKAAATGVSIANDSEIDDTEPCEDRNQASKNGIPDIPEINRELLPVVHAWVNSDQ